MITTQPRRRLLVALPLCLALCLAAGALRAQCPPIVTPYAPANGSVTTETRTSFSWSPSVGTGYDLWVSQNGGAAAVACRNTPSPDCTVTLAVARYEWFVRTYNNACLTGSESAHFTFEITGCSAPVAPTVLAPDNGAITAATGVSLSWSGGTADTYDVFLDQGTTCSATTPLNATPLTASSFVLGTLTRDATYAWRVRASRGSTCPAPQLSHCATFRVRSCDPPATPAPTLPADGAIGLPSLVTFSWVGTSGATGYNVWARTGGGAFSLAGSTSGTSLTAAFSPGTAVEWYVDAVSGGCTSSSRHQTFNTASCVPTAATPLSPIGTIGAGSPIVFRWSLVPGAERYRIWLAPAGGAFVTIEETSELTFTAHRPAGTYDWYVESIGGNCPSARSQSSRFLVPAAQSCAVVPPGLTAPGNGATVSGSVTFNWSAVAGATRYEVWAALNTSAPALIGTTTAPPFTTDLAPGRIQWYVVAHRDGCDDLRSGTSTVDVTRALACDSNTAPLLLAPADDAQQLPASVDFFWTNVAGAQDYKLWVGVDDAPPTVLATTTAVRALATVPRGRIRWFVEATFGTCGSRRSASSSFRANAPSGCANNIAPMIYAPAGAPSGITYDLHWTPAGNVDHYEVFESTPQTAATPNVIKTGDVMLSLHHDVTTSTRYQYRVRAVSNCGAGTGPLSPEAAVIVTPAAGQTAVIPFGAGAPFVRPYFVAGRGTAVPFTASSDRPWLTITPSSGTLPPEGITLTLRADLSALDAGDSVATIRIDTPAGKSSGPPQQRNATSSSGSVSVTLVTPVAPGGKTPAASSSLILPAVAHLDGLATFRSDVRLANTGPQPLRYQLTFTPSATDATRSGQQTFVQVESGATIALNDLLQSFFGAAPGASASGTLEIKPLSATSDTNSSVSVSFASSRTFAVTPGGTSGQFIPALPLSRFAGLGTTLLVPQVSQSGAFRTNVGIVEAATQPAHVVLSFFDALGNRLSQVPLDLLPGEHRQLNGIVTSAGALANAVRMEINVTSATGLVTAYASVLDQTTSDPMLIDAVALNSLGARHYVVPGIAALDAGSGNRWRSDMRVYNASSSAQPATLIFTPQGGAPQSVPVTLAAGEVRLLDDVVRATFGADALGGSVAVATTDPSKLAVTARTYFDTGAGTYGQYIPAFTESGGTGVGERAQQILQVEQSANFRTNLGLIELAGSPITVEVKALIPELKVQPTITLDLQPNQFVQYGSILAQLGYPTVYNSRIAVRVISGAGRVAGYGCLIDNSSGDPTYVPSQ